MLKLVRARSFREKITEKIFWQNISIKRALFYNVINYR
jgi:hypothetical protein